MANSSTEDRALALLGSGISPVAVAGSLGISESRISQLLSDENFAAQVAEMRFQSLQKHNARDSNYDALEDDLMERLKDCLPLMHRPMEILKAIQVINAAKRRGSSTPDAITEKTQIIQLNMPINIINKFQTNIQGQVTTIETADATIQNLLTIQSGALDSLVRERRSENGGPALIERDAAITANA